MIIKHAENDPHGGDVLNTFVAYDDLGEKIGQAFVVESMKDMLCPARPHHLLIRTDTGEEALDALMGAATARALMLAKALPGVSARIFAECAPDDERRMQALLTLGYHDDDKLVRMWRPISRGPIIKPMPIGCTVVRDYLEDESERKYFLERYNAMFATEHDEAWMRDVTRMPDFARILLVNSSGLMGEMITWCDGGMGVVGAVQTPPAWQRRGVGSYLMELAREHWLDRGMRSAYFDVWTRLTGALRLAATSGFRPAETLLKYPGIDVD